MDSLRKASGDVDATNSAVKRILTSLMEGNAEHALVQENAKIATSGLALVAQNATGAVVDFLRLMEEVGSNVVSSRGLHLYTKTYIDLDFNGCCSGRHGATARRGHR
jgi:hypothetical protein